MATETPVPHEITRLLRRWKEGDREALSGLAVLTYDELRAIAAGYLRRENRGHTLQATGLVNEAYPAPVQTPRHRSPATGSHFYAFTAQMMRMILIDHARQAHALKRPAAGERVPLHDEVAWIDASSVDMIALDAALDRLETISERKVRVIELRFFLGCTNEEAAQILNVSRATIDRDLEFSKAWLHRQLSRRGDDPDKP